MKTRKPPTRPRTKTVKRLFALSSNRCAFDGCGRRLISPEGVVLAEIAHIRAQNEGGPRWDGRQTPEERHGFENLILLCQEHHKVIDEPGNGYSVERLVEMKEKHEGTATGSPPELEDDALDEIYETYAIQQVQIQSINQSGGQVIGVQNVYGLPNQRQPRWFTSEARTAQLRRELLDDLLASDEESPGAYIGWRDPEDPAQVPKIAREVRWLKSKGLVMGDISLDGIHMSVRLTDAGRDLAEELQELAASTRPDPWELLQPSSSFLVKLKRASGKQVLIAGKITKVEDKDAWIQPPWKSEEIFSRSEVIEVEPFDRRKPPYLKMLQLERSGWEIHPACRETWAREFGAFHQ